MSWTEILLSVNAGVFGYMLTIVIGTGVWSVILKVLLVSSSILNLLFATGKLPF